MGKFYFEMIILLKIETYLSKLKSPLWAKILYR